jgi:hypothetical protein
MLRAILICCVLVVTETALVILIVSHDWIESRISRERALMGAVIGGAAETELDLAAGRAFTRLFEDTGIRSALQRFALPTDEERANSVGLQDLGSPLFDWAATRLEVLWHGAYQALYRLIALGRALPCALLILVPSVVDGLMQRKVKQRNFGYASPVRFNTAIHCCALALYSIPIYLFLPLAITPTVIPAWTLATSLAVLLLTSNLQKRI